MCTFANLGVVFGDDEVVAVGLLLGVEEVLDVGAGLELDLGEFGHVEDGVVLVEGKLDAEGLEAREGFLAGLEGLLVHN